VASAPPTLIDRAVELARIDLDPPHRQPTAGRVVLATVLSVCGSLLVDAVLVAVGTAIFPATKGYVHFAFTDYAKLTVIGVIGACVGWPIVTRFCAAPRWLYLRLAVLVTLVLLLPDVWLLMKGSPPKAVLVLVVMHLAIALVTYSVMVRVAPVRRALSPAGGGSGPGR
jgi:hypothetical protein